MPALPSLPTGPLRVEEARALPNTAGEIDMVWPLWGWASSDDLVANGLAVFSGPVVYLVGYDPLAKRWTDVSRLTDIGIDVLEPISARYSTLESWLGEHYSTDELVRFDLTIEFETRARGAAPGASRRMITVEAYRRPRPTRPGPSGRDAAAASSPRQPPAPFPPRPPRPVEGGR